MGPLHGVKVIEFAGLGPTPFCATMLADAGADVVRIESGRPNTLSGRRDPKADPLLRNRRCLAIDLKRLEGKEVALRLACRSDVLLEGFRPGVMERLGLGPAACMEANPALVYARMTGWGQSGPLKHAAGHDLNYIALSGALHAIGIADRPVPPLNLLGDFGGGGMMMAFGIASALWQATRSGRGQVIDAAMSDGAALLMAPFYGMVENGSWLDRRESNVLDGAAPFYGVYRCADGGFISIAPLEPKFYDQLLSLLELDGMVLQDQSDQAGWPRLREELELRFLTRSRDEWCALLEGTDVCFAPVLAIAEAPDHPHHVHRGTFVQVGHSRQPAPAPRFLGTPAETPRPQRDDTRTVREIMGAVGYSSAQIDGLEADGVIASGNVEGQRRDRRNHVED